MSIGTEHIELLLGLRPLPPHLRDESTVRYTMLEILALEDLDVQSLIQASGMQYNIGMATVKWLKTKNFISMIRHSNGKDWICKITKSGASALDEKSVY